MSRTRKACDKFCKVTLDYVSNLRVPSKYKLLRRKSRRLKEKLSLRKGEEVPLFKKSDSYDYS